MRKILFGLTGVAVYVGLLWTGMTWISLAAAQGAGNDPQSCFPQAAAQTDRVAKKLDESDDTIELLVSRRLRYCDECNLTCSSTPQLEVVHPRLKFPTGSNPSEGFTFEVTYTRWDWAGIGLPDRDDTSNWIDPRTNRVSTLVEDRRLFSEHDGETIINYKRKDSEICIAEELGYMFTYTLINAPVFIGEADEANPNIGRIWPDELAPASTGIKCDEIDPTKSYWF